MSETSQNQVVETEAWRQQALASAEAENAQRDNRDLHAKALDAALGCAMPGSSNADSVIADARKFLIFLRGSDS